MKKTSKKVARLACQGNKETLIISRELSGCNDCYTANQIKDGSCQYGCLGLGDCLKACKFEALSVNELGIVEIDEKKCVGCGSCVKVCPRQVLSIVERENLIFARCNANGLGKYKIKICRASCIGCTSCALHCPTDAITIVDGLAVIDYQKCNNCGQCLDCCPACLDNCKVIVNYLTDNDKGVD